MQFLGFVLRHGSAGVFLRDMFRRGRLVTERQHEQPGPEESGLEDRGGRQGGRRWSTDPGNEEPLGTPVSVFTEP
ncbi:hypothetical protein NDU88_003764 [Pleurodeles waltl]|uniref:Uncharacterized protein n=1 Tax=Pleurodeles waltl TaxID=8319 RepID=A0AAV7QGC0_PLEWA|nr:hypothetical protein NDU88_003764 [Pleurodeles waltl]